MLLFYIFMGVVALARLQFLTAVILKVQLFWDVKRLRIVSSYRCSRAFQFRRIQGQAVQRVWDFLTLKMKAMRAHEEKHLPENSFYVRSISVITS